MTKIKEKLEKEFERWIEWKLYKILYLGIIVPLLIGKSKEWLSQDLGVALAFTATAIILLLPAIFKVSELLETLMDFLNIEF
ncbi:MAG: hypothetical protein KC516_00745 [Nanoarchaeota archaeon]|nr:hypothetical protein [Nanoarchaeota archaeon]